MDTALNGITVDSAVMNGQACIPWYAYYSKARTGGFTSFPGWQDLLREYPDLEEEDIRQVFEWAEHNLDDQGILYFSAPLFLLNIH